MAPDIKAVFFDVDGTLLSHKLNNVPVSTRHALRELRQRGIRTIIATGRHISELEKLPVGELQFDGYLTLNGQLLLDEHRKAYAGTTIDQGEMEILGQIFNAKRIPFCLISENNRYINYVDKTVVETQEATMGTIPEIGDYKGEKIYQIIAFVHPEKKQLLDDLLDECSITSWNDTGIDIIPKDGGKTAGIRQYLINNNIKQKQTMAFGDGENDIEMLKYVSIGVAMGNASDEVKEAADYVTDSVDNHGIANALRHFELID